MTNIVEREKGTVERERRRDHERKKQREREREIKK